jgi:hypothetical protein
MVLYGRSPRQLCVPNRLCRAAKLKAIVQNTGERIAHLLDSGRLKGVALPLRVCWFRKGPVA